MRVKSGGKLPDFVFCEAFRANGAKLQLQVLLTWFCYQILVEFQIGTNRVKDNASSNPNIHLAHDLQFPTRPL
jgi:hypothetical protein